jgi:hypothetical protein
LQPTALGGILSAPRLNRGRCRIQPDVEAIQEGDVISE